MDLIAELAGKLGVERRTAETLAGAVLGAVQAQLQTQAGPEAAAQLEEAIPELDSWQQSAQSRVQDNTAQAGATATEQTDAGSAKEAPNAADALSMGLGALLGGALQSLGGGGSQGTGGLLGALAGGGANKTPGLDVATLAELLRQLNLQPEIASGLAPIILKFLQERLPEELMLKVNSAVPLLRLGLAAGLGSWLNGLRRSRQA